MQGRRARLDFAMNGIQRTTNVSKVSRAYATDHDTPEWPVDRHAEQIVLGHVVEDWQTLKARIRPDLLWDKAHRRIFDAMLRLEEHEEPVDKQTIVQQLMRDGPLKDGDISLLSGLEGGFGFSMLEPYIRKLENVWALRQAAQHAQKIVNEACMTGADIREVEKSVQRLMRVVSERSQREHDEVMIEIPSPWDYEESVSYLIEDLVIENAITMWSGESGDGKSTLALALAAAVARGEPSLGRRTVQRPVLYLDRENPVAIIKERLNSLGIPDISDWLKIWGLWWTDHYPPGPDAAAIIAYARRVKPFIIWDFLIAFAGCDENSSSEMRSHMSQYRRLVSSGATVLVIHHRSEKGDAKYRGSSDIRAAVDAAWEIKRDDGTTAADPLGKLVMAPYKTRNYPGKAIRIEYCNGVFIPLDAPPVPPVDIVVDSLRTHPGANQKEMKKLGALMGLAEHKMVAAIDQAIREDKVIPKRGKRSELKYYLREERLAIPSSAESQK
jgi:hypothetical protein